jgi:hypothetical protein
MSVFRNILRDCRAIALVEFALALPVLLLFLLGTIEFGRFAILHQKLDKAAHTMADLVTQSRTICATDLDDFASAIPQIMKPFTFDGGIIFNSIVGSSEENPLPACEGLSDSPCIAWQHNRSAYMSMIGSAGGSPTLPSGYILLPEDNIIAVELFYEYNALLSATNTLAHIFLPQRIQKTTIYKPRQNGSLTTLC